MTDKITEFYKSEIKTLDRLYRESANRTDWQDIINHLRRHCKRAIEFMENNQNDR